MTTTNTVPMRIADDRMVESDEVCRLLLAVITASRALTQDEAAIVAERLGPATKQYGVDSLAVVTAMEAIAKLAKLIRQQ